MVAKTPAKKAPAKRKPRAKKPVDHAKIAIDQLQADFVKITTEDLLRAADELRNKKLVVDTTTGIAWKTYAKNIAFGFAMLAFGAAGGIWSSGGIKIGPTPRSDVLSQAYDADRVTQIAVLRELAEQPFDGATDDGRKAAGEFYNERRFLNRGADYAVFTDALANAINENKVKEFADKLESK